MVKKKEKKNKPTMGKKTPPSKPVPTPMASPTPPVWNPFDVIENMERYFWEDPWTPIWWRRWPTLTPWAERWLESDTKYTPMDMVDMGKEYKITAEMPGVEKKNLDVNVTENAISICGETNIEGEKQHKGYIRHERSYSTLCRTMGFPEEVNPDKAEATLKDGILEITVSKKTPTANKGRKIPVH